MKHDSQTNPGEQTRVIYYIVVRKNSSKFGDVYMINWWNLEHDIDSKDTILMFYKTLLSYYGDNANTIVSQKSHVNSLLR